MVSYGCRSLARQIEIYGEECVMSAYDFIAADRKMKPVEIGVENKGHMIIIENENHVLGIYDDKPSCYTEPFTDLPIIMSVQIGNFENIRAELFSYVKDAIKENTIIEVWSTWMGETDGIERKIVHENNLTADDLQWVYGLKDRSHPRCLKIYKWIRGKK